MFNPEYPNFIEKPLEDIPEEEKEKQSLIKEIIDDNYEKIEVLAGNIYEKLKSDGIKIEIEYILIETLNKISNDEDLVQYLQEHGYIDDKIARISVLMAPLIEQSILTKQTEISEQRREKAEKTAEKVKGVCKALLFKDGPAVDTETIKEILTVIVPENPEGDYAYIEQAGDRLDELADQYEGKKASAIKIFAYLLKNKTFQNMASGVFREWLETSTGEENFENKASAAI